MWLREFRDQFRSLHFGPYVVTTSRSLNCLVLGDDPEKAFTVEIPKNEIFYALKRLIKEKKSPHLNHIAASDLAVAAGNEVRSVSKSFASWIDY